ncbi:hypothetical protein [Nocardia sp. NPDC049149]|uniref:hypothetical protein n=1 Tax=Nocardia sp. NPDC049149 TaxID=3364315 RepID=UPI003720BD5A
MIDTDVIAFHEDPAALDDYQRAHREQAEQDRLCELVTDSLARSMFADLTAADGQEIGEEVLAELGCELTRKHAVDLLADNRFTITLAQPPDS